MRRAEELLQARAQQLAGGGVGVGETAGVVEQENRVERVLEDPAPLALAAVLRGGEFLPFEGDGSEVGGGAHRSEFMPGRPAAGLVAVEREGAENLAVRSRDGQRPASVPHRRVGTMGRTRRKEEGGRGKMETGRSHAC